jgi:U3 small nucleolar ribonucleoprotein protein IMP4
MILVTTSRRADPLVRRIGKDLAFAAGGRYLSRGKAGLSSPPFSDGLVLVLSREGQGIRMQLLDGTREVASLRFPSVREGARTGPLRRGLFTGDPGLLTRLSPHLPVRREEDLAGLLLLDGVQGRRISLGVGG